MTEFEAGKKLILTIERLGCTAYLVGGCVRDILLGLVPHDIDLVTSCSMDELEEYFTCHDIGQSKSFGIVCVEFEGFTFEVAQMRVDGESSDSRHPDEVMFTDDIELDLSRRDFTINAMAMEFDGTIIDPFGGQQDLLDGVVRCVGDPVDRFQEDTLRMIRAVRFASRFNFILERSTFAAIRSLSRTIDKVSPERIKGELFKMASGSGNQFAESIKLLDRCKLLEFILPEVKALQNVQEEPRFHPEAYMFGDGTPFDHTMEAIKRNVHTDPMINVAVLLHDLGKSVTHELDKGRYDEYRHRFHGHGHAGVRLVNQVADRLKFSNDERDAFVFTAQHHMDLLHTSKMRKSKASVLANHELFRLLTEVMYCDDSCRGDLFDSNEFFSKIEEIVKVGRDYNKVCKNKQLLDGKVVMELTGLPQGKELGQLMKDVTEKFLDGDDFVCIKKLILDSVK